MVYNLYMYKSEGLKCAKYIHAFSQNVRRIIPYVHAMDVSRFYVMGVTLARYNGFYEVHD